MKLKYLFIYVDAILDITPTNVLVPVGKHLGFKCSNHTKIRNHRNITLKYVWSKLDQNNELRVIKETNSNKFSIKNVTDLDEGIYTCEIKGLNTNRPEANIFVNKMNYLKYVKVKNTNPKKKMS